MSNNKETKNFLQKSNLNKRKKTKNEQPEEKISLLSKKRAVFTDLEELEDIFDPIPKKKGGKQIKNTNNNIIQTLEIPSPQMTHRNKNNIQEISSEKMENLDGNFWKKGKINYKIFYQILNYQLYK